MDTKSIGYKGWKASEEKTIAETGKGRDEEEEVWIFCV